MADSYLIYNGPMVTTAAPAGVTTGTAIKTLHQVATPATRSLKVIQWSISFDGTVAANAPIKCELIDTDVAATVTAHVAAGVQKWGDPNAPASLVTLGVSATGYTASAEGSITASRLLDFQFVNPTSGYTMQFPLGREPEVGVSRFLRIRVTAANAVNAICYTLHEE